MNDKSDLNPEQGTQRSSQITSEVVPDHSIGPVSSHKQEDAHVATTCKAEKADGTRCSAAALPGSEVCYFHDPTLAIKRREAQALGGRQNRVKTLGEDVADVKVRDRRDVAKLLLESINQVRKGTIDPRVATTIGYLANILIGVVKQDELEKRIEELEAISQPRRSRT